MTDKENIRAILECYFTGFKEEIIDSACNRILEQKPCGKDINVSATDAISRQAAIDALGECPMNWTDSDAEITAERNWLDTVKMLKSLPSVTPQPKTEVLDKIRAEVEQLRIHKAQFLTSDNKVCIDSQAVLDILDKYKK